MTYLRWIGVACLTAALVATFTGHPYINAAFVVLGFACLMAWVRQQNA